MQAPGPATIAKDAFALHQKAEGLEDRAYDLAVLVMQSDAYLTDHEIREATDRLMARVDIRAVLRRH